MIDDHRGVVSGDGATAVRAERLAVLLDTEILPCLERPSRLLGPFDGVFRSVGRTPDVAFIWPSLAEGPDTPEALRPLLASALLPPEMQLGLACAPAPDVERALRSHAIPWFARPALCPLADAPQWVVWLESPLQLLGLLSVFVAAGVQPRASRRAAGAPRVFISGPAADRVRDVAGVYADAVITPDVVARHLSDLASPGASSGASTDPGVFPGGLEAPSGPDLVGSHDEAAPAVHAARGSQAPWLVADQLDSLRIATDVRHEGRGDSYTRTLRIGAASADLRQRLGLMDSSAVQMAVDAVFAETAGEVEFEFVLGLPGESTADRVAIGRMIADTIEAAPRGARQVRAHIGAYLPAREDLQRGARPASPVEVQAAYDHVRQSLPTKRTRVDFVPSTLGAIESTLRTLGAEAAPVLERIHAAGGRRADADAATAVEVWRVALRAQGLEPSFFDEPVDGVDVATGVASPSGLVLRRAPEPEPASSRRRSGRARRKTERPDRWARWEALVPRQFDHRIEFAKRGRLRFLGAGEVTELFLRACERAGLPLATSGVAQPRPRIRFGPSLTTGVEGLAEVVDLGLEIRVPDLLERLRPHVPEDLGLRTMLHVPVHASDTALSRVALTEYEATLSPDLWSDPDARATSRARVKTWHRRLLEGLPCSEDDDDINQLRTIELTGDSDGTEHLRYVLDLRGNGSKIRPREVLERGLAEVDVDVRCIPLRRLRLLTIEDDMGRDRLVTPIEQALRVERRLRARAKLSA